MFLARRPVSRDANGPGESGQYGNPSHGQHANSFGKSGSPGASLGTVHRAVRVGVGVDGRSFRRAESTRRFIPQATLPRSDPVAFVKLLRRPNGKFVPDANDASDAPNGRFRAGLLVRLFDHPPQGDDSKIHFRDHAVTGDREIPVECVGDFGVQIRHALPATEH